MAAYSAAPLSWCNLTSFRGGKMAFVRERSLGRFSALMAYDAAATTVALYAAAAIRFEGRTPVEWVPILLKALPVLVACRLAVLWAAKMHRWSFFLSGLEEGVRLAASTLGGTLLFSFAWFGVLGQWLPL